MSYLCISLDTVGGHSALDATHSSYTIASEVVNYVDCPLGSWVVLSVADMSSNTNAMTTNNLKTLFDSYFIFDLETAQFLTSIYLAFFVSGYALGVIVKWMRRV